ncbi:MAG: ubiquitin-like protein Pup [Propionibacteriaceae bacterium]|nr:ubiquitin-like protein Pup [Propionibacteriaceae bacterium]
MTESRHEHIRRSDEETAELEPLTTEQTDLDDFDSILDEIDGVLEANAAEFVRSFVQKGGE